jgi:hypothetical protein
MELIDELEPVKRGVWRRLRPQLRRRHDAAVAIHRHRQGRRLHV